MHLGLPNKIQPAMNKAFNLIGYVLLIATLPAVLQNM